MSIKTKSEKGENDLIISKKYVVFIHEFFLESEKLLQKIDELSLSTPQLKNSELQKLASTISAGIEIQPAMFIASILTRNKTIL